MALLPCGVGLAVRARGGEQRDGELAQGDVGRLDHHGEARVRLQRLTARPHNRSRRSATGGLARALVPRWAWRAHC